MYMPIGQPHPSANPDGRRVPPAPPTLARRCIYIRITHRHAPPPTDLSDPSDPVRTPLALAALQRRGGERVASDGVGRRRNTERPSPGRVAHTARGAACLAHGGTAPANSKFPNFFESFPGLGGRKCVMYHNCSLSVRASTTLGHPTSYDPNLARLAVRL